MKKLLIAFTMLSYSTNAQKANDNLYEMLSNKSGLGLNSTINLKTNTSFSNPIKVNTQSNNVYRIVTVAYFLIAETVLNYKDKKFDFGFTIENSINQKWKDSQLNTKSNFWDEDNAVSEIYYSTARPFFIKAEIRFNF
jgi:hypothetical protein